MDSLFNAFGDAYVFEMATYEPGSGKSALLSNMISELMVAQGKASGVDAK